MLKINAKSFVGAINALQALERFLDDEKLAFLLQQEQGKEALEDLFKKSTVDLSEHLTKMGLPLTLISVERLMSEFKKPDFSVKYTKSCLKEIRKRMRDELDQVLLFTVSKHKSKLELTEPLFGSTVDDAFPSAAADIEEAGKCLALSRSTACVFHLMRALEIGLRSLAAELNVPLNNENWNSILRDIETEIRSRQSKGKNAIWSLDDETYYSEACTSFFAFKNAWRNHTMHYKNTYTQEKAEEIYTNVRAFMKHLATRIKETTPRRESACR